MLEILLRCGIKIPFILPEYHNSDVITKNNFKRIKDVMLKRSKSLFYSYSTL